MDSDRAQLRATAEKALIEKWREGRVGHLSEHAIQSSRALAAMCLCADELEAALRSARPVVAESALADELDKLYAEINDEKLGDDWARPIKRAALALRARPVVAAVSPTLNEALAAYAKEVVAEVTDGLSQHKRGIKAVLALYAQATEPEKVRNECAGGCGQQVAEATLGFGLSPPEKWFYCGHYRCMQEITLKRVRAAQATEKP